nr:alpha-ketoglutarate dehydrogenase component 4-like [Cherax quadricarinatus]
MVSGFEGAWKAVNPHIPLIKFRKGGLTEFVRGSPRPLAATGPVTAGSTSPTRSSVVLEEWQVPQKYRRERITDEEIEYINRGGPA